MDGIGSDIWSAVAEAFERLRGRQAHDLWLKRARPVSFHRGLFTLGVDEAAVKAALDGPYRADLESLFLDITGSPVRVRTEVADEGDEPQVPAAEAAPVARSPVRDRTEPHDTPVDPTAFVETAANALAKKAVDRWIEDPAGFNPLFLHGPVGSGKSALAAYALARLVAEGRDDDPLALSGESLSQDVSSAARSRSFGRLQRSWAGRQTLLLDEAHRLRGRHSAQAHAVSLVEPILGRGGRVLVLSRHPPRDIFGLGDRLQSHFLGGMVVSLHEPDAAARQAVLSGLADQLDGDLGEGVLEALSRDCPGTLGDGVAWLRRELASCREQGRPLDLDHLRRRLPRAATALEASLDGLVGLICEETGLEPERLRSAEKSRDVAAMRHLCVYLAHHSLGLSSRRICRSLGLRSPSIVSYARRAVGLRRGRDPAFEALVLRVQARLEGAQRDLPWTG